MIKTLFHAQANGQVPEKLLSTYAADEPDYSLPDCWLQVPELTKDVDTFYVYPTVYFDSSFEEGAPDYAALDNPEMLLGALGEYATNASVYEDSTNVFVPYYRQSGMRYANEVSKKTGNIDAALSGISYDDMSAALDYYFEKCNNGRPFIIAGHSQGFAKPRLFGQDRIFAEARFRPDKDKLISSIKVVNVPLRVSLKQRDDILFLLVKAVIGNGIGGGHFDRLRKLQGKVDLSLRLGIALPGNAVRSGSEKGIPEILGKLTWVFYQVPGLRKKSLL